MAFTCRLPAGLDKELTRAAEEQAVAKQVLIEKILREWLQREALYRQRRRDGEDR